MSPITHWEGLNDNLIAKIFPVDSDGNRITVGGDFAEIHAPLLDGSEIEATMNWQSPFENSGAESVSPAITSMLQAGNVSGLLEAVSGSLAGGDSGSILGQAQNSASEYAGQAANAASQHEGRSGMTKLNSTQIFTGSMPIRFPLTAVFRAYADPKQEVEMPVAQLWKWALPQKLQEEGIMAGALKNSNGVVNTFLPSVVPQMVGITYKGRTFAPMVIESISEPMDSPIDADGNYTQMLLPMTLASLTALDRGDWVTSSSKT